MKFGNSNRRTSAEIFQEERSRKNHQHNIIFQHQKPLDKRHSSQSYPDSFNGKEQQVDQLLLNRMFKKKFIKNGGGRVRGESSPENSIGEIRFSSDRDGSKESSGGERIYSRSKSRTSRSANTRSPRRSSSGPRQKTSSRSKDRKTQSRSKDRAGPLSGEMIFDEGTGSFRDVKNFRGEVVEDVSFRDAKNFRGESVEEVVSPHAPKNATQTSIMTANLDLSADELVFSEDDIEDFGDEESVSDGIGSAGFLVMENFDEDSKGSFSDMSPLASDIESDRASSCVEEDNLSYTGSTEDFRVDQLSPSVPLPPNHAPPKNHSISFKRPSAVAKPSDTIRVESLVFTLLTTRPSLWSNQDVSEFLSLVQYEEMKQYDLNGPQLLNLPNEHTSQSLGLSPHDFERFVSHIRHLQRIEENRLRDESLLAENKVLQEDLTRERNILQQKEAEICDLRNAMKRSRSKSKDSATNVEARAENTLHYVKTRLQDLLDFYTNKKFEPQDLPRKDELMDVFSIEILFNQLQEKIQKNIEKEEKKTLSPRNVISSRRTSLYSEFEETLVRERMGHRNSPAEPNDPSSVFGEQLENLKEEFTQQLNQAEEGYRLRLQAVEENLERAQHKNALYEDRIRNSLDDSGLVDFREELSWLEKTLSHRKNETQNYVERRIAELKNSYEKTLKEKQQRIRMLERALFDTIPSNASNSSPVTNPPFNGETPYHTQSVSQLEEHGVIALKSRIHEEIIGTLRSENERLVRENTRVLSENGRRPRSDSLEGRSVRSDQSSVVSSMDYSRVMQKYRKLQESRLVYKERCKELEMKFQYLKEEKRELKRDNQILRQKLVAVENEGEKNVVALEELLDRKQLEVARGFSEMKKVRLQIQTLYAQMFSFFIKLRKEHEKRMGVMRYNIGLLQSCLSDRGNRNRAGVDPLQSDSEDRRSVRSIRSIGKKSIRSFHSTYSTPQYSNPPTQYERHSGSGRHLLPQLRPLDDEYYLRARTQREFTEFIKAHFDDPPSQPGHTLNYSTDSRQPARGSSVPYYEISQHPTRGASVRSAYGIRI